MLKWNPCHCRPKVCTHLIALSILQFDKTSHIYKAWAVVVVATQLVERLLPTEEVRDLNPIIGQIYIERLLSNVLKRQK